MESLNSKHLWSNAFVDRAQWWWDCILSSCLNWSWSGSGGSLTLLLFFLKLHSLPGEKLHTLDVCRTLLYYLNRTKPFILFSPSSAWQYPACWKVKGRNINVFPPAIGWLASLFLQVLRHTPPGHRHELPVARSMPVPEIWRADMWSNPLTFVKHYALDMLARADAKFRRAVLQFLIDWYRQNSPSHYQVLLPADTASWSPLSGVPHCHTLRTVTYLTVTGFLRCIPWPVPHFHF